MSGRDQMRAAWARRTDEELLHAYFLEELSESGRRVIAELVAEKVGSIEAFVAGFAAEQGQVIARVRVRSCQIGRLPLMTGVLVLASKGAGFVPRGLDEDRGNLPRVGGIAGSIASSILSQMKQTSHAVPNLSKIDLPVPLIAHVEPTALWLPRASCDSALWSSRSGELTCGGSRLIAVDTLTDAKSTVAAWAQAQGVSYTSVAGSPILGS